MSLTDLLILPGHGTDPTAAQHNGLLDYLFAQRLRAARPAVLAPRPWPHPWRVSVERFTPPDNGLATLAPESTWRVNVAPATINDRVPSILYRRKDDPRGWRVSDDYAEDFAPALKASPIWVERDLLEDPDDPPFLTLADPPTAAKFAPDFSLIPDNIRNGLENGAFCSASDWEMELWRAHVLLSATPFRASAFNAGLPPPALVRYRLYAVPTLPAPTFGAQSGGTVEIATLYLLRDPNAPAAAEIRVRQREFWPLWSQVVQPGSDFAPEFASLGIDASLDESAYVAFWSV